ncbi:MAG TPA: GNAT family N-acetyltransferase, partial [Bdellovibrionales bacterium]|nr:GNAT family N-acetyltransferase [Bdellovibrionales bacterium]
MKHPTRLIPTLHTDRLILRPFKEADAERVQVLAGHRDVAATTANLPHPYPDGAAESWINMHQPAFEKLSGLVLAIELKASKDLIGCVSLTGISQSDSKAEVGYWIGVE